MSIGKQLKALAIIGLCASTLLASATGYNSGNLLFGGFSETQLAPNVFEVHFRGNALTSKQRTKDFLILRSAELCLDSGYRYFGVAGAEYSTSTSYGVTPRQSNTTVNFFGNTATANTTYSGGQLYSFTKPKANQTILCKKSKPRGFSYDARFIKKSIRAKYKLDEVKS